AAQADPGIGKLERRIGVAENTHRLTGPGNFGSAAGRVGVQLAQRLVHGAGRDAQSLHLGGVEHDPNLAVHAAGAADRRHALDREQPPRYFIVDEPAQLLHRHVVGLDREITDRAAAADFDLADARLEDSIGQVAAHLIDGVLDVVDRLIGIGADHELHAGVAAAFA